jgi:WD40 repeat protein
LLETATSADRHEGEVYGCIFSSDGGFVLSGGWDGQLRLWETTTGAALALLHASPKPLSSCAFSPDGLRWLAGSMEGMLTFWDAITHQYQQGFVAHTRPISAITFSPDGNWLATASWDRQVILRKVGRENDGRPLSGHEDIVAGCRFTVDGKQLLSWSHDTTLKLWNLDLCREIHSFSGHTDRIITASLSPDGRWALSGSRDQTVRLWDLEMRVEVATINVGADVRVVLFLPDAESIVVVDGAGRIFLMGVPGFEVQAQLQTSLKAMCGDLTPSGALMALGCEDGRIYLAALEGREDASLVVTATQSLKPAKGLLNRLMGTTKMIPSYRVTCPACHQSVESTSLPAHPIRCPHCRRRLRVNPRTQAMQSG